MKLHFTDDWLKSWIAEDEEVDLEIGPEIEGAAVFSEVALAREEAMAASVESGSPMTIPERIMEEARKAHAEFSSSSCADNLGVIIARAIMDAEERGAARAIVVKPLEWHKNFESKTLSWSETIIGRYRVWSPYGAEGEWYWELSGKTYAYPAVNSEDEAKAAAQADYEACIRSALKGDSHG